MKARMKRPALQWWLGLVITWDSFFVQLRPSAFVAVAARSPEFGFQLGSL